MMIIIFNDLPKQFGKLEKINFFKFVEGLAVFKV